MGGRVAGAGTASVGQGEALPLEGLLWIEARSFGWLKVPLTDL